ncbi:MAG: hypothetical protein AAF628_31005 [Planctomycetota bacterium]
MRIPLGIIGLVGCDLLVSADSVFPIPNVLGAGLWSLELPASTAGITFYNQGIISDLAAGGLRLSDAAEVQVSS